MNLINAMSASTSSNSPPIQKSFQSLPEELLIEIIKSLKQNDIARLPAVNRETNRVTDLARHEIRHLDISFNTRRTEMTAAHLRFALKQYPNYNSIDIGGYKKMKRELQNILLVSLRTRLMISFFARNTALDVGFFDSDPWNTMLSTLDHTPYHTHFGGIEANLLEYVDLTGSYVRGGKGCFIPKLISSCPKLREFKVPSGYHSNDVNFVRNHPPSLEHLGPNWPLITDASVEVITSKFIPANIKACDLRFAKPSNTATAESRMALLRFLPLSEMLDITLHGGPITFSELWGVNLIVDKYEVLSYEMVEYIATKVTKNTKLEILNLTGLLSHEQLVPTLVMLINSIESTYLRKLKLSTPLIAIPDMTQIEQAIRMKLPRWENIVEIQINEFSLADLRVLPSSGSSSYSASHPLNGVTALFQAEADLQAEPVIEETEAEICTICQVSPGLFKGDG